MPARHVIKPYVSDAYYHVYNRGVNKTDIFIDEQDYAVFLSYLRTYVTPKDEKELRKIILNPTALLKDRKDAARLLRMNNYFGKIELVAYVLMPNHFHLLFKQQGERDIEALLQSLTTRYTAYVNRRHKRVGSLLQGTYKAVLVTTDEQLLHLTRYIHRNPLSLKRLNLLRTQPSSYQNYLGIVQQEWIKPKAILTHFGKQGFTSYQSFVESNDDGLEENALSVISRMMIDEN
ncbi:MAG: transposase [Patescibacteria group bacterium]